MNLAHYLDTYRHTLKNGVYYLSDPAAYQEKEACYIKIRDQEGRLYSDDQLRQLPVVPPDHPLSSEWRIRATSLRRLSHYLRRFNRPLTLLDIGCGNGWMSNQLSHIWGSTVWAVDVNQTELEQGARVFSPNPALTFLYADIMAVSLPAQAFDAVILGSSIQYFPDRKLLIERLISLLAPSGEIHILDSPFYTVAEALSAEARSKAYFQSRGVPEMAKYYHQPLWDELNFFQVDMPYDPRRWWNRLQRRVLGVTDSPFAWIRITSVNVPNF
ncbi:MAG: class I SAM-dependent methyltransferase [Gemmatimonadetes bacterium]|nr:MAG: class I SAM-dependent methyltransferase [Gemmatimonadota bacterium]